MLQDFQHSLGGGILAVATIRLALSVSEVTAAIAAIVAVAGTFAYLRFSPGATRQRL